MDTAEFWIDHLELRPHPEGGYYRRTFQSERRLIEDPDRRVGSSIYYLLPSDDVSRLHRLDAEEQWHHYRGAPLTLHRLDESGYQTQTLGPDPANPFQVTVPSNVWFGATVEEGFALVGCSVFPGFTRDGFELAEQSSLLKEYPEAEGIIRRLT